MAADAESTGGLEGAAFEVAVLWELAVGWESFALVHLFI